MQTRTLRRLAVAVSAAALLSACGGATGDGADPLGSGAPAGDEQADGSGDRLAEGSDATDPNSVDTEEGEVLAPSEPGGAEGIAEGEPNPNAPGSSTAACSAGDLMVAAVQPEGVPGPVADTWNDLRAAAMACDYERLASLASPEGFTFSYGDGGDPAGFWAEAEARGDDPMAKLVQLTGLSVATDQAGNYVWPAVHARYEDEDAWDEVTGVYPPDVVDEMREAGGYFGYRIGITPEGDWIFFVAGD